MKLLKTMTIGLLLGASQLVLAEDHTAVALEQAHAAAEHGKMGHASILVEHAEAALEHTLKALETAEGEEKMHLEAAVKVLEYSIEHGKLDHADMATPSAEEAVEHIKAAQPKSESAPAAEDAAKPSAGKWPIRGHKELNK
ncbi:small metal-binding protein SmbP [Methylicorpusculum oleiharenae]|uniref:small metal-binding protein SmbP n=1 Tax=Methylicorpusculum oleiharenae TaxID=1338687 RepID=UPI00135A14AB